MRPFDPSESLADTRHEFGEHGGVNLSIEASTTFTVMRASTMPDIFHSVKGPREGCYLYGRHWNPTVHVLARQLAAIEGTEEAYCTASGMGAISALIVGLCDQGDRVVASDAIYGGTFALLRNLLPKKMGLRVSFVDVSDLSAVERACDDGAKLLYVETMSNPTLVVADLPRLAEIAHRSGALLVVDNTFCPMVVTPTRFGADVVLHSLTKFVSGASDIIGGVICASQELIGRLVDVNSGPLMLLGPTMEPKNAFELSLRLPHLGLRMQEHGRRAQFFARRLAERGLRVIYPGLPDHPQHDLIRALANPGFGLGGIFDLDLGGAARANELMEALQNQDRFGFIAVSLGYFDTLMSCSASSTSSELSEDEQAKAGISQGLVRVSIGYTGSLEQRWRQMEDALKIVGL